MKQLISIVALVGLFLVNVSVMAQEADSTKSTETQSAQSNSGSNKQNIQETVLGMNVSGNKELPNVLYIVPWKSDSTPAPLPQVTRMVDEIYAPVDPEVFTKQVKFYHQLTSKKEPVDGADIKE